MRITAYADRLVADLDRLDWPDSVKAMQRNWIGRSEGAQVRFDVVGAPAAAIEVFTTRPDTLFGATYMVLAPEHPLVDAITPARLAGGHRPALDRRRRARPAEAVAAYRAAAARKSELDRQENKDKTGVFTGAYAVNPVNGQRHPGVRRRLRADGLRHRRDHGRARPGPARLGLRRRRSACRSSARSSRRPGWDGRGVHRRRARRSTRPTTRSAWTGWASPRPSGRSPTGWSARATGEAVVQYKLRDWLFSRQRYWGEPFPIVWDERRPGRAARRPAARRAARDRRLLAEDLRPGRRGHRAGAAAVAAPPSG